MSRSVLPWVALVGVGGGLGALVWAQSGRIAALEAAPKPVAAAAPAADPEVAALKVRLAVLEADVAELREDRSRAFKRLPVARRAARAADGSEEAAADAPVAVAREAVVEAIKADDGEVREHLREIIKNEREAEREQRMEAFRERSTERIQALVHDLAESAALREPQRAAVETQLLAEQRAIEAVFKRAREDGAGWREARHEARVLRTSTDAQVKATLEPEQFEQFQKLRDADGWGPGRGRGRGDDEAE